MSEVTRVNWKQVVVTALISGVVAIGTGMTLFNLQRREPQLTFRVTSSPPFESPDETVAIESVEIANEGTRAVSLIAAEIKVPRAEIRKLETKSPPGVKVVSELKATEALVSVPNLNPGESVFVSMLVGTREAPLGSPVVAVRGEGVVGRPAKPTAEKSRFPLSWLPALAGAYAGLAALFIARRKVPFLSSIDDADEAYHRDDQNRILAFIVSQRGDLARARMYLTEALDVHYWSEADFITNEALHSGSHDQLRFAKEVLEDLLLYTKMASRSEGLIHYNISRLAAALGDTKTQAEHSDHANRVVPKLVQTRKRLEQRTIIKSGE